VTTQLQLINIIIIITRNYVEGNRRWPNARYYYNTYLERLETPWKNWGQSASRPRFQSSTPRDR